MKYSLKNLKINRALSQETLAFSASIYLGNKRVGEVINHGCGGVNVYFADAKCPSALRDFRAFANGNEDVLVDSMIENVEFKKTVEMSKCQKNGKTGWSLPGKESTRCWTGPSLVEK